MDTNKPFRLLENAQFQQLSSAEKIAYLGKAIESVKRESVVVAVVDPYRPDKTVPLPGRKR